MRLLKLRVLACTGFLRFILLQFDSRAPFETVGPALALVLVFRSVSVETRLSFAHHLCTFQSVSKNKPVYSAVYGRRRRVFSVCVCASRRVETICGARESAVIRPAPI